MLRNPKYLRHTLAIMLLSCTALAMQPSAQAMPFVSQSQSGGFRAPMNLIEAMKQLTGSYRVMQPILQQDSLSPEDFKQVNTRTGKILAAVNYLQEKDLSAGISNIDALAEGLRKLQIASNMQELAMTREAFAEISEYIAPNGFGGGR